MSDSVAVRLTSTQSSVIWPGLDFIVKAEATRRKHHRAQFRYPFEVYPPPAGFDRGTMNAAMMEIIISFWRKLRAKHGRGGRLQLSSIELRSAMFAVRVTLALKRLERNRRRKIGVRESPGEGVRRSIDTLGQAARRTIRSLERHMKRANRALLVKLTRPEYQAYMQMWREHLRWMRLHLVYFKPSPPIVRRKRTQQRNLDILMDMAAAGLRYEGYAAPEPVELRRIMRLYSHSAARGREGRYTVHELVSSPKMFSHKWYLARFVMARANLKRLS